MLPWILTFLRNSAGSEEDVGQSWGDTGVSLSEVNFCQANCRGVADRGEGEHMFSIFPRFRYICMHVYSSYTFVSYKLVSRILDLVLEGYNILRTLGYIALRFLGVIVPQ